MTDVMDGSAGQALETPITRQSRGKKADPGNVNCDQESLPELNVHGGKLDVKETEDISGKGDGLELQLGTVTDNVDTQALTEAAERQWVIAEMNALSDQERKMMCDMYAAPAKLCGYGQLAEKAHLAFHHRVDELQAREQIKQEQVPTVAWVLRKQPGGHAAGQSPNVRAMMPARQGEEMPSEMIMHSAQRTNAPAPPPITEVKGTHGWQVAELRLTRDVYTTKIAGGRYGMGCEVRLESAGKTIMVDMKPELLQPPTGTTLSLPVDNGCKFWMPPINAALQRAMERLMLGELAAEEGAVKHFILRELKRRIDCDDNRKFTVPVNKGVADVTSAAIWAWLA